MSDLDSKRRDEEWANAIWMRHDEPEQGDETDTVEVEVWRWKCAMRCAVFVLETSGIDWNSLKDANHVLYASEHRHADRKELERQDSRRESVRKHLAEAVARGDYEIAAAITASESRRDGAAERKEVNDEQQ
jgi:hypothetical protein